MEGKGAGFTQSRRDMDQKENGNLDVDINMQEFKLNLDVQQ